MALRQLALVLPLLLLHSLRAADNGQNTAPEETSQTLNRAAWQDFQCGQYPEAYSMFQQAINKGESDKQDPVTLAAAYYGLGEWHRLRGAGTEALKCHLKSLELRTKYAPGSAEWRMSHLQCALLRNLYVEAPDYLDQCAVLLRQTGLDAEEAHFVAALTLETAKNRADDRSKRVARDFLAQSGPPTVARIILEHYLGRCAAEAGQVEQAAEYDRLTVEQTQQLAHDPARTIRLAEFLDRIGNVELIGNEWKRTDACWQSVSEIWARETPDSMGMVYARLNLANLALAKFDFGLAAEEAGKCLQLAQDVAPESSPVAKSLLILSLWKLYIGGLNKIPRDSRAIPVLLNLLKGGTWPIIPAFLDEAEVLAQHARSLLSLLPPSRGNMMYAYVALTLINYFKPRNVGLADAERYARLALGIYAAGAHIRPLGFLYLLQGAIAYRQGDKRKGDALSSMGMRSIKLVRPLSGKPPSLEEVAIGTAFQADRPVSMSEREYLAEQYRLHLDSLKSADDPEAIKLLSGLLGRVVNQRAALDVQDKPETAFNLVEESRAFAYRALWQERSSYQQARDPRLRQKIVAIRSRRLAVESELNNLGTYLARSNQQQLKATAFLMHDAMNDAVKVETKAEGGEHLGGAGARDTQRDAAERARSSFQTKCHEYEALSQQRDVLRHEETILLQNLSPAKLLLPAVTFATARERLPADTTYVAFSYGDKQTLVFIMCAKKPLIAYSIPTPDRQTRAFCEGVYDENTPVEAIQKAGNGLFHALFPKDQYRSVILLAKRLVFSPDGSLWRVPFAALLLNGPKAQTASFERKAPAIGPPLYLGQKTPLCLSLSLTIFFSESVREGSEGLAKRFADKKQVSVVIGNIALPNAALLAYLGIPRQIKRLINTEAATQDIARLYHVVPWTDTIPTEAALRKLLPKADVIHIFTHAIQSQSQPLDAFLLLAAPDCRTLPTATENDCRLQVWEVLNIALKADLVTLAACGTGRGAEVRNEGAYSLAWAFEAAGCRSVVASLWSVKEKATAQIMMQFHRQLQARDRPPKDEALRCAMQSVAKAHQHPYYWAGFFLLGSPDR